jgi:uncharacterized protein YjiS (DUF1127 family)
MIIMEAILSALALLHKAAQSVGRSVVRTFKRWRAAYTAWHRERQAIAELSSMSDSDLRDIGINRCEILRSVRGDTAHAFFRIRRNTDLVQNIAAEREKDHTSPTHRSAAAVRLR